MNENDVLFQKVTQAHSEKNPSAPPSAQTIFVCVYVWGGRGWGGGRGDLRSVLEFLVGYFNVIKFHRNR